MTEPASRNGLRSHQAATLSLLFCVGVVNFFDRAALSVANTTVRAEMHMDATEIGWLLSAFSLAYGLSQLPLVSLIPRAGTRSVLGAGLALWSLAQLLTGFVRSLPVFIALRVLLGAGEAPFYPAGVQSVREWFSPRSRGRATAIMSMSQTLGLATAPPVLTWLMLRFGWRAMFVGLGVFGLIVAAAWMTFYPRRPPALQIKEGGRQRTSPWRILIRQRMVWGMMLGFGGINYTNWLYTTWMPGYLQAERQLSIARSGWVASIPFLAGAAGMLLSGTVSDRLAQLGYRLTTVHRTNIVAGMVLSAACSTFVARSSSTAAAVAGISGALFFVHFAGTSGWGYVQAVSQPRFVASLSALQNFASFMIASAAPIITGWLLDRTHSFTIALDVCSAVTLLGAVCYATLAAPVSRPLDAAD